MSSQLQNLQVQLRNARNIGDQQAEAKILVDLSDLLAGTDDRDEALAVIQEAVEIYRQLADANPAAFLPNVASALNNLGVLYRQTQQLDEAEKICQEAQAIREKLAASVTR